MTVETNGSRWSVIKMAVIGVAMAALTAMAGVIILSLYDKAAPEGLIGIGGAAVGALATLLARVNGNGNGT